jgi:hypothetical protein
MDYPVAAKERVLAYRRVKPAPSNSLPGSSTSAAIPAAHMSDNPQRHDLASCARPGPAFENGTIPVVDDQFYRFVDQLLAQNSQLAASRRSDFFSNEAAITASNSQPTTPLAPPPPLTFPPPAVEAQSRTAAFLKDEEQARSKQWHEIAMQMDVFVQQNIPDPAERQRVLAEALERCRAQIAKAEEEKFRRAVLEIHDTTTRVEGIKFTSWRHRVAWNASRWFSDTEERNRFLAWDIEQIRKGAK